MVWACGVCGEKQRCVQYMVLVGKPASKRPLRGPRHSCVRIILKWIFNSKELGVLILTVEHNYICLYYYKEDIITTTCFGPMCGPFSGCD